MILKYPCIHSNKQVKIDHNHKSSWGVKSKNLNFNNFLKIIQKTKERVYSH